MGQLEQNFGMQAPPGAQSSPTTQSEEIPPERMGFTGEYDQSGLAKRVALALDEDGGFDDVNTLYVAQHDTTVVFRGQVPSQDILDKAMEVAKTVSGAGEVHTDEVVIG